MEEEKKAGKVEETCYVCGVSPVAVGAASARLLTNRLFVQILHLFLRPSEHVGGN